MLGTFQKLTGAQWASVRILADGIREVVGLKLTNQGGL